MKIICLPKESRRFVMTIYVEGQPWKEIHSKIFGKNFTLPICANLEELKEKFASIEYAKAKKYALDCLARRSYPSSQLKKLLERNLISPETIKNILQDCIRLGYLNDIEWMERFVKTQLSRNLGPQAIVFKLMNKGIPLKEAEKCVDKFIDPEETNKSIQHLIKTKYKKRKLNDYKEKQKVFASLLRKGFDVTTIQKALNFEE